MLGRATTYFIMAIINSTFDIALFSNIFKYQFNVSLLNMYILIVPYILATIFLGLLISNFFTKRETPVLFLVFVSPLLLFLSGVSWPKELIPKFLVYIFSIFPSTTMLEAYNRVAGMGSTLGDVKIEISILYTLVLAYFLLASHITYKNNK